MSRRCVLSSSAQAASQRDGPPRPRHSPSASPYGWDSLPLVVGGLGRCCLPPQPVGARYRSLLDRPRAPGVTPAAPPRAAVAPPFAGWPDSSPAGGGRRDTVLEPPPHRPQTSPPEVRLGILVTVAAHDHFSLWGRCCGSLRSVHAFPRRHGLADSARAPHGCLRGHLAQLQGARIIERQTLRPSLSARPWADRLQCQDRAFPFQDPARKARFCRK